MIEELEQDAKHILNTPEGERLLEDFKHRYGFYRPTFQSDPYETAYAEGQRSVLLFLMQLKGENDG